MTRISAEDARAGSDNNMVRHVLGAGLVLAVVALGGAFMFYAA